MLKHILATALWLSLNVPAMALEELPEEELSMLSAQDGVSVLFQMPNEGIRMDAMALVDKNGIDTSILTGYNNAGRVMARNVGIKTCAESAINGSCSALVLPTFRLKFDAVGDHNGNGISSPMLNVSLTLGGGANKMRFYIDKIALSNSAGNNEQTLIDFGGRTGLDVDAAGDYIDIVPQGSNKTILNMQFGFQRQGHMIQITNGNFGTIDFGTVSLIDGTNTANSLRFGLALQEFDITGSGIDIINDGLWFRDSNFGKGLMDITISDVTIGGASAASLGSFGANNISVTGLEVTLAGKN